MVRFVEKRQLKKSWLKNASVKRRPRRNALRGTAVGWWLKDLFRKIVFASFRLFFFCFLFVFFHRPHSLGGLRRCPLPISRPWDTLDGNARTTSRTWSGSPKRTWTRMTKACSPPGRCPSRCAAGERNKGWVFFVSVFVHT